VFDLVSTSSLYRILSLPSPPHAASSLYPLPLMRHPLSTLAAHANIPSLPSPPHCSILSLHATSSLYPCVQHPLCTSPSCNILSLHATSSLYPFVQHPLSTLPLMETSSLYARRPCKHPLSTLAAQANILSLRLPPMQKHPLSTLTPHSTSSLYPVQHSLPLSIFSLDFLLFFYESTVRRCKQTIFAQMPHN
jgi:hypothetical protein